MNTVWSSDLILNYTTFFIPILFYLLSICSNLHTFALVMYTCQWRISQFYVNQVLTDSQHSTLKGLSITPLPLVVNTFHSVGKIMQY